MRLSAIPRDSAGNALVGVSLTWSSSDTSVATVSSSGLVTAKDLGETDIDVAPTSAASNSVMSTRVSANSRGGGHHSRAQIRSVPKIVITPSTKSVDIGATIQYSASVTDMNGNTLRSTPTVRWRSSVPAVATIDNSSGLATAVGKGTASISVVVSTSRSVDYEAPAPAKLAVGVCSGLLDVISWDATSISSSYNQEKFIPGTEFTVDIKVHQSSSGTAHLVRVSGGGPRDTTTAWEGTVVGSAKIDNTQIQNFPGTGGFKFTTTEYANQAQRGASFVRLSARFDVQTGKCTAAVRYQDDVPYQHRETSTDPTFIPNNFTAESPTGIAFQGGFPAGEKPTAGWSFQKSLDVPAVLFPDDSDGGDLSPLIKEFYLPAPGIAALLLQLAPNFTLGTAHFQYVLTAR
ncbi:MAG: Ig-like domain-containing protein [Gemmatimonadota bacterium]|nr:Ig-like domain-containing protein [Gemmatimonadota bacterium]